jgi:hypothetical protein
LVRSVEQELVGEHVELHPHRPGRFLTVALEHAQATGIHDADAILQVLELCFVQRWQVQAVVLQVRHAEKDLSREGVRLQVAKDDLADVPADVYEVVGLEDMLISQDKAVPLQGAQDVGARTRKEVRYDVPVEIVVLNFIGIRLEQQAAHGT